MSKNKLVLTPHFSHIHCSDARKPLRKLAFIEQANKRQSCLRIIAFVRLIDYALRNTLHQVRQQDTKTRRHEERTAF
jgi:hypothetical protein